MKKEDEDKLRLEMEQRYGCKFSNSICIHCLGNARDEHGNITDEEVQKVHLPWAKKKKARWLKKQLHPT